jgi:type VI secretion system FHA domain protein
VARAVPLVVRVDDLEAHKSERYAFIKSPVRVGRSEINDLHLDRPYVSTWHGLVQLDGDRVTFVDLGSTNGTTLDGVRLEKNVPAEVHPDSELRIGSLRLQLARGEAGDAAPAPRRATQFAMRAVPAAPPAAAPARPSRPRASPDAAARPSPPPVAPAPPAAPRPSGPPPPSDPGRDHAREALDDAAWQLQVLHDAYADAKRTFAETAASVVERVPEPDRARCRALLAERFEAAAAPGAGGAGAAPAAAPVVAGDLGAQALALLRAFAESYLPAGAAVDDPAQLSGLLEAVADALETSARSYIELRRGYEEFGKEMGIRVAQGDGPVARARDTRQLLAWLLQRSEGEPRAAELGRAFADLMIHQVALMNGVTEGGKALLARLSPEAITEELEKAGAGRLALGVKTLREGAQWRAYLERYRELTEEDSALTEALFGKDFARAYSAVAGRREPAGDGDADATPRPGPARHGR